MRQAAADLVLARKLMAASGYTEQTAVVLSAADQSIVGLQATIAAERTGPDAQAAAKRAIAARTGETAPFVITGQFRTPTAFRSNLTDILPAPVPFFWTVKTA